MKKTPQKVKKAPQKKRKNNKKNLSVVAGAILIAVILTTVAFSFVLSISGEVKPQPGYTTTEPTTTEPPVPYVTSTATIGSAGDILIHKPILESAKGSEGYSFQKLFTYTKSVTSAYDYFVLNLETTLAGTEDGRTYTTYPRFNSPDSLLDAVEALGTDCLLTANNHSYDTKSYGFLRTIDKVDEKGFDHVGSRKTAEDKKYFVKNIKDISFGFTCYTYETPYDSTTIKALNGIEMNETTSPLVNSFDYDHLDTFYTEIEEQLKLMKGAGAEVSVIYVHWGDEYKLSANSYQKAIAQKLCDIGFDVIIGGHPHVVEPVELITSTDGKHKTVCVYSVGNFLSNQRRNLMGLKTGHTEDGLIFEMTFSKYSDGTVVFDSVDVTPTWVHLYNEGSKQVHSVVPLSANLNAESLGLNKTSDGLSQAKASYERTMALVKEGTDACNEYLSSLPRPDEETTEEDTTVSISDATDVAA
ncbi:MAG: CapA family protein [Acutalibacteraceae bacterium]|nr:CapA family protein [Acutalibacteraceae bacterium]